MNKMETELRIREKSKPMINKWTFSISRGFELWFLFFFFLFNKSLSQELIPDSALLQNSHQENAHIVQKPNPLSPEKIAWEMMLPFNYKKPEKTPEMKSYEQMLMGMRAGVGELSLLVGEFELNSFEKNPKINRKK